MNDLTKMFQDMGLISQQPQEELEASNLIGKFFHPLADFENGKLTSEMLQSFYATGGNGTYYRAECGNNVFVYDTVSGEYEINGSRIGKEVAEIIKQKLDTSEEFGGFGNLDFDLFDVDAYVGA